MIHTFNHLVYTIKKYVLLANDLINKYFVSIFTCFSTLNWLVNPLPLSMNKGSSRLTGIPNCHKWHIIILHRLTTGLFKTHPNTTAFCGVNYGSTRSANVPKVRLDRSSLHLRVVRYVFVRLQNFLYIKQAMLIMVRLHVLRLICVYSLEMFQKCLWTKPMDRFVLKKGVRFVLFGVSLQKIPCFK